LVPYDIDLVAGRYVQQFDAGTSVTLTVSIPSVLEFHVRDVDEEG
jgi:hypothetical protein